MLERAWPGGKQRDGLNELIGIARPEPAAMRGGGGDRRTHNGKGQSRSATKVSYNSRYKLSAT
jgi:hypothetical protein